MHGGKQSISPHRQTRYHNEIYFWDIQFAPAYLLIWNDTFSEKLESYGRSINRGLPAVSYREVLAFSPEQFIKHNVDLLCIEKNRLLVPGLCSVPIFEMWSIKPISLSFNLILCHVPVKLIVHTSPTVITILFHDCNSICTISSLFNLLVYQYGGPK